MDFEIKLSVIKKLPKGFDIVGLETIKNPWAMDIDDPELVQVLVVDFFDSHSLGYKRTAYFDYNTGDYIGDI